MTCIVFEERHLDQRILLHVHWLQDDSILGNSDRLLKQHESYYLAKEWGTEIQKHKRQLGNLRNLQHTIERKFG